MEDAKYEKLEKRIAALEKIVKEQQSIINSINNTNFI